MWETAGIVFGFLAGITIIINLAGPLVGSSMSKYFFASSSSTAGAKGRYGSLNFILLLTISFIEALLGSARILRCPKALGPHSNLPSNQPTTFFWVRALAISLINCSMLYWVKGIELLFKKFLIWICWYPFPRYACVIWYLFLLFNTL